MNLNETIINIRVELQNSALKKSGKNKFAGFEYYELSDFLPKLNELMLSKGVNDVFTIKDDTAMLDLVLKDERQSYTIPFILFDTPKNKNGQDSMQAIQYLGALNTYYKRYLYLNAFGITDGEVIDSMNNNETTAQPQANNSHSNFTPDKVSASQVKLIQTRLSKLADRETNEAALKTHYKIESWNDLPAKSIQGLLDWFTKNGV